MKALTLDDCQKFVQICFWIVSGTILVLTYLRARKSVLSTVNTEYQKRVMDRLQKLSEQLYEEFDVDNLQQWVMNRPLLEGIKQMNEEFEENKEHFLEKREWDEGFPYTSDLHSLNKILNPLKTDPFVPTEIRKGQCQKAVICCTIASPILSISYVNRPQKRQAVSSKSW